MNQLDVIKKILYYLGLWQESYVPPDTNAERGGSLLTGIFLNQFNPHYPEPEKMSSVISPISAHHQGRKCRTIED